MPEPIYDSEFIAKAVRWLQLKFGRGPSHVDDVIVPVLDLTALLSRAPDAGGGTLLGTSFLIDALVAGQLYKHYLAPQTVVAGEVGMRQAFNPLASGKHVIVYPWMSEPVAGTAFLARRLDTQLATADAITTSQNLKSGEGASAILWRKDDQLPAAVPPAGAGPVIGFRSTGGSGADFLQPVYLREGEGLLVYPCSNNPATDSAPAGTINQPMTYMVVTLEFRPS